MSRWLSKVTRLNTRDQPVHKVTAALGRELANAVSATSRRAVVRKPKGPTARARAKKARASKLRENKNKQAVRRDDVYCRFPLCRCRELSIMQHVSHQVHKGMGGNPKEDRSIPSLMIMLCAHRHREAAISIDNKTLRWRGRTTAGARGPVTWQIKHEALVDHGLIVEPGERSEPIPVVDGWVEVAVEIAPHTCHPLDEWQRAILDRLAGMIL